MKKNLGFTLIELMTTIVIIGILATVAVPTYQDFVEKSKTAEAHTTFSAIAKAELTYYYDNKIFLSTDSNPYLGIEAGWHASPAGESWALLGNVMPEGQQLYFMYTATAGTGSSTRSIDGSIGIGSISDSLVASITGMDQIESYVCGGSIPLNLASITFESLGVTVPTSGNYEWVVLMAIGKLNSNSCTALFSLIEAGEEINENGSPRRSPTILVKYNHGS